MLSTAVASATPRGRSTAPRLDVWRWVPHLASSWSPRTESASATNAPAGKVGKTGSLTPLANVAPARRTAATVRLLSCRARTACRAAFCAARAALGCVQSQSLLPLSCQANGAPWALACACAAANLYREGRRSPRCTSRATAANELPDSLPPTRHAGAAMPALLSNTMPRPADRARPAVPPPPPRRRRAPPAGRPGPSPRRRRDSRARARRPHRVSLGPR